jgi:hypothetical protein
VPVAIPLVKNSGPLRLILAEGVLQIAESVNPVKWDSDAIEKRIEESLRHDPVYQKMVKRSKMTMH